MGLLCIVDAKDQKDLVHYSSQQPSSYKKKVLQLADGKHLLTGGASQGKKTVLRYLQIPSTVGPSRLFTKKDSAVNRRVGPAYRDPLTDS